MTANIRKSTDALSKNKKNFLLTDLLPRDLQYLLTMDNNSSILNWPPDWINIKPETIQSVDGKTVAQLEFHNFLQQADRTPKILRSYVSADHLNGWNPEGLQRVLVNKSVEVYVSASGKLS